MSCVSPRSKLALAACLLALTVAQAPRAGAGVVFTTDFNGTLPPGITAPGSQLESAQGLAGLGAPGNQFGGSVLRYHLQTLHDTSLTLTGLPPHTHVSIGCLLALIDSWDGTELMQVEVDGQLLFSHWFQLATGDDSSYVAPAGGLLSSGVNLGWSAGSWYGRDRALDLSVEPALIEIPHTASTLTVVWKLGAVSGGAAANWQGGTDESWAIDNLTVSVGGATSDVPLPDAGAVLLGNAPNPFNPSTRIFYELPAAGARVTLSIHDLGGRLVRTLVDGERADGPQATAWDGHSDDGQAAPGGVYFYRLSGSGIDETRKMVLLK
jgi:hypothetical protein